jgi:hypothetical protein
MDTDKNRNFTVEDILLIGCISIGFTKMVMNITSIKAKTHAQLHSHQEIKPLVLTYLLYNLPIIIKDKSKIRPLDIRRNLPLTWQKIQYADLTDILNSFRRIGILTKVNNKQTKVNNKPGHPKTHSDTTGNEPDPKSYYQPSGYYNNLENVLNKPEHVKLIYTLVLESGLLYKFLKHNNLESYHIIRKNDKKTTWNILQTLNLTTMKEESDFESDYIKLRNVKDRELEVLADRKTRLFMKKHKGIDYKDLYLSAGSFFRV